DSSDNDDDRPLNQDDKEKYPYLEPLELFITRGSAFARFKKNLGYLLRPPADLTEALESRDLHTIQRFLRKNVVSTFDLGHEWLHELDNIGYSKREIAELLLEDVNDSPWIYFTPQIPHGSRVQKPFHVPGCAHQTIINTRSQLHLDSEQVHP